MKMIPFRSALLVPFVIALSVRAADTSPPTAPQDLIAVMCTATSITLQWSPSRDDVGVTGYRVVKNGVALPTVTSTSTTVTGLTAGISYQFSVQARDAAGN